MSCKTMPQNHAKQCLPISAKTQAEFKSAWMLSLSPMNIELFHLYVMLFSNIPVKYSDKDVLFFQMKKTSKAK